MKNAITILFTSLLFASFSLVGALQACQREVPKEAVRDEPASMIGELSSITDAWAISLTKEVMAKTGTEKISNDSEEKDPVGIDRQKSFFDNFSCCNLLLDAECLLNKVKVSLFLSLPCSAIFSESILKGKFMFSGSFVRLEKSSTESIRCTTTSLGVIPLIELIDTKVTGCIFFDGSKGIVLCRGEKSTVSGGVRNGEIVKDSEECESKFVREYLNALYFAEQERKKERERALVERYKMSLNQLQLNKKKESEKNASFFQSQKRKYLAFVKDEELIKKVKILRNIR